MVKRTNYDGYVKRMKRRVDAKVATGQSQAHASGNVSDDVEDGKKANGGGEGGFDRAIDEYNSTQQKYVMRLGDDDDKDEDDVDEYFWSDDE